MNRVGIPVKLSFPLLPPEVRKLILCHLPDPPTLRKAILSHSCLNNVFVENRSYITKCVVISYISPELIPVALSVLESSRIEPWSQKKALDLLDRYKSPYSCPPYQWNFHDALCLAKMHSHVCFFTRGFVSSALSKHPLTGNTESPSAITANEWRRIAQNFYIFELYSQLFRKRNRWFGRRPDGNKDPPDFDIHELRELNKKRHSFWEIEQQTCVFEYLFRELSRVYNDIALHDVEWGVFSFEGYYADTEAWDDDKTSDNNSHKIYFLLAGLSFIRSFVTTDTFEEGRRLIHSRPVNGPHQHSLTLKWKLYNPRDDGAMLKEYTPERLENEMGSSFLPDLDHGPAEAWLWVHASATALEFGYSRHTRYLRARGYVMWDYARLVNWRFFQSEWMPPNEDNGQSVRARKSAMERARARKKQLVREGARGWWSEEDESQLTWEHLRDVP